MNMKKDFHATFYRVMEQYIQSEMTNCWKLEMAEILRIFLHGILNSPIHVLSQLYSNKAQFS